jgi:hypothetical protein
MCSDRWIHFVHRSDQARLLGTTLPGSQYFCAEAVESPKTGLSHCFLFLNYILYKYVLLKCVINSLRPVSRSARIGYLGNKRDNMREHQITINLRPDQFQEVQRLSRAAGSRSIGLFAREKLLTALGLSSASASVRVGNPDLKSAASDIRRLHRELQTFIAESLSTKDYAYGSAVAQPVNQENMLLSVAAEDLPIPLTADADSDPGSAHEIEDSVIQEQSQTVDEMEELAERAFAISPRLGAIDELSDDDIPFSDPLDELLGDIMAAELAQENQESASAFVKTGLQQGTEIDEESWQEDEEESQPDFSETPEVLSEPTGNMTKEGIEEETETETEDEDGTEKENEEETATRQTSQQAAQARSDIEREGQSEKESHEGQAIEQKTTSDDEVPVQSDDENGDPPPDPPPPPANLSIPPPISGGPPPRKRRT